MEQYHIFRRYILDLRCPFDYSKMPKDKHPCKFIFYPLAYDKSAIIMKVGNLKNNKDGIIIRDSVSSNLLFNFLRKWDSGCSFMTLLKIFTSLCTGCKIYCRSYNCE